MTCPCGDEACPGPESGVHDINASAVVELPPIGVLLGLRLDDGE